MGWFCNTPEAKKQMEICEAKKCPGCHKCVWIEESSNAMEKYGTEVEPTIVEPDEHPLFDMVVDKFNGTEIG